METREPQWHHIIIDEEVHHFLNKVVKKGEAADINEVLRSMIFGEKMGMSAEAREAQARAEEAHAQVDIRDLEGMEQKRKELKQGGI